MPQQPASSSTTSTPGIRLSSADRGGRADLRLLVAVPVVQHPPAGEPRIGRAARSRPSSMASASSSSTWRTRPATVAHPRVVGQQRDVLVAQREQAGRLAADDRASRARSPSASGARQRARPSPWRRRPGPWTGWPARSSRCCSAAPPSRPARAARSRPGRCCGSVNEVNESARNVRCPGCPSPAAVRPAAANQRAQRCVAGRPAAAVARRCRARAPITRRSGRDPAGQVRHGCGRRAEPVEQPDGAEHPRAQRHAVHVVVVRERLALERRHVDAQRALALARLAHQAEVEDLVQPLVARARPSGRARDSALTSALARPRVECSSSRVAMYDGHIAPVVLLRHSPMFMQRSAAPRMPPTHLEVEPRRDRPAPAAAPGRAGAPSSTARRRSCPGSSRRPGRRAA